MLRYFLFMSRFSRRGQWGIILGAYFGNQILRSVATANPSWAPWILPIQILYIVFALMTWIASPLFNLMLRLNRFGRMVLSRDQVMASNCIGLVLLLALLSLAGCLKYGFNSPWLLGALMFGMLLLPVAGTFKCPPGGMRACMAVFTGIIAAAGIGSVVLFLLSGNRQDAESIRGLGSLFFSVSLLGAIGSGWVVNILLMRRRRK